MTDGSEYACPGCTASVQPDSDFCPRCGTLFLDGVTCERHPSLPATGACVICAVPFCRECRASSIPHLCDVHASYEVYEGMARIYGTFDPVHAEYLRSCLEQEGFHPFVYSRKASSIHIGGPEYTGFMSSGDSPRVIVNEFKLLVPCAEVLEAEAILRTLDAPADTTPDSP